MHSLLKVWRFDILYNISHLPTSDLLLGLKHTTAAQILRMFGCYACTPQRGGLGFGANKADNFVFHIFVTCGPWLAFAATISPNVARRLQA